DGANERRYPFWTYRDDRRGGGIGDVDELEMRACGVALWWRKRRGLSRQKTFGQRARTAFQTLHAGNDPVYRPSYRHHRPRHGHKRTSHGMVHGHLFGLHRIFSAGDRDRKTGQYRRNPWTAGGDWAWNSLPSRTSSPHFENEIAWWPSCGAGFRERWSCC